MVNAVATGMGGYTAGGSAGNTGDQSMVEEDGSWKLEKCVQAYDTYLDNKVLEIQEQQNARRYRHGAQWTADQVKALNDRKQPVVTYNKIGRKIDGIVGLVERLKQDPKAFPRTPAHQQGADLATAVLRYLMDANRWNEISPLIAEMAAVDGLAGIELDLKTRPQPRQSGGGPGMGHNGGPPMEPDYDVIFRPVDNDGFFYDARSFKHDFSDARYLGMGKYVDEEMLKELLPDMADDIAAAVDSSSELNSGSDRDVKWFQTDGDFKQVRLVDIWYKSKGGWRWALFTGSKILKQGTSPFFDDDGKEFCKYLMFSSQVDHDGDRYGFPRNLQSAQDEVNQRRSKGLHELNNRRIIATKAAIADGNVEAMRREAARADGIVLVNNSLDDIRFDDQAKQAAVMGQLEFMRDAAQEIENFGPNPALAGGQQGLNAGSSGRAIALVQQAGIAELGPYMLNLRAWKVRVYRALFHTAQRYWTNQRWIRVTDAQGDPQFVQINELISVDPATGMPMLSNAIGELDVDIILDEGPDTVTLMQDTYDAISQALPAVAPMLSPTKASAVMDVLIETSPLPADIKKKFRDAGQNEQQQPDPKIEEARAKLALQQQESQGKLAVSQQESAAKIQTANAEAAAQLQIERERSQNEMAIERDKAQHEVQLELFKAEQTVQLKQQQAVNDAEHQRRMLAMQPQPEPDRRLDDVLATLQQHHGVLQQLSKPRKAVIRRDPRGKIIDAELTLGD